MGRDRTLQGSDEGTPRWGSECKRSGLSRYGLTPHGERPDVGFLLGKNHVRRETGSSWGLALIPAGGATYKSRRKSSPPSCMTNSSPLSTPRPGPMIHPRGLCALGESKPESPLLTRSHQISRRLFLYKRKRISHLTERNQTEQHLQHYQTKSHRTHTQDLRLFRCELSKLACLPLILYTLRLRDNPSVTAAEKAERNDKKEGTSDWVETWGGFRQACVGSW